MTPASKTSTPPLRGSYQPRPISSSGRDGRRRPTRSRSAGRRSSDIASSGQTIRTTRAASYRPQSRGRELNSALSEWLDILHRLAITGLQKTNELVWHCIVRCLSSAVLQWTFIIFATAVTVFFCSLVALEITRTEDKFTRYSIPTLEGLSSYTTTIKDCIITANEIKPMQEILVAESEHSSKMRASLQWSMLFPDSKPVAALAETYEAAQQGAWWELEHIKDGHSLYFILMMGSAATFSDLIEEKIGRYGMIRCFFNNLWFGVIAGALMLTPLGYVEDKIDRLVTAKSRNLDDLISQCCRLIRILEATKVAQDKLLVDITTRWAKYDVCVQASYDYDGARGKSDKKVRQSKLCRHFSPRAVREVLENAEKDPFQPVWQWAQKQLKTYQDLQTHHIHIAQELRRGHWTNEFEVMTATSFNETFSRFARRIRNVSDTIRAASEGTQFERFL